VDIFDEELARRDLRRYRRRGLDRTARRLIDLVAGKGADVLEVGGGVGGVEIELLRRGADRATNIELSPAYEQFAEQLLRELGLAERVERRLGDIAQDPEAVEPADVVVMHRVVCCYPDMPALVGAAAGKARRALALSYPRDTWWTRFAARVENQWWRLVGRAFRNYVHRPTEIAAVARGRGLRPLHRHRGAFWELVVFERPPE
jgi:magnesium-protoporphyrin O-methyltransferase